MRDPKGAKGRRLVLSASLLAVAAVFAAAGRADGEAQPITISGAAYLAIEVAVGEFRRGNPDPELLTRTIKIDEQPDRILVTVFRKEWRGGALLVTVSRDGNRILGTQWMR